MEVIPSVKDIEVSAPWADYIFSGTKKVEVRKNDPSSWGATQEGDFLRVMKKGTTESKAFRVVAVRKYTNLDHCLMEEGVSNLLPGMTTIKQGRAVYLEFDGPTEQEKRSAAFDSMGAIAIELEPLDRKLSSGRTTPRSKNIITVPPLSKRVWIKYGDFAEESKLILPPGVKTVEIGFDAHSELDELHDHGHFVRLPGALDEQAASNYALRCGRLAMAAEMEQPEAVSDEKPHAFVERMTKNFHGNTVTSRYAQMGIIAQPIHEPPITTDEFDGVVKEIHADISESSSSIKE